MLFNTQGFLLLFLPLALLISHQINRFSQKLGSASLLALSLIFYFQWPGECSWILALSILVNFLISKKISPQSSKFFLFLGILFNLGLLFYFKYRFFIGETFGIASSAPIPLLQSHLLPLGISFFTFQQMAYLVDLQRGTIQSGGLLHYSLFVSFFPQLIAGPIVRFQEVFQQFRSKLFQADASQVHQGLIWIVLGFAKKTLIADPLNVYVSPVFELASNGTMLGFGNAALGVLAFSAQIYYDFSAYSEMAVGLALLFGISLPLNFNSPYQSTNPRQFWKRWHRTLSDFFKDYLYIPLGGNRRGWLRNSFNLWATFTLVGLWHGANWNFVFWGLYHAALLVLYRALSPLDERLPRILRVFTCFTLVSLGWVLFRSNNGEAIQTLYSSLFFLSAASDPLPLLFSGNQILLLLALVLNMLFAPNIQTLLAHAPWARRPVLWALALSLMFVISLLHSTRIHEFIYFVF